MANLEKTYAGVRLLHLLQVGIVFLPFIQRKRSQHQSRGATDVFCLRSDAVLLPAYCLFLFHCKGTNHTKNCNGLELSSVVSSSYSSTNHTKNCNGLEHISIEYSKGSRTNHTKNCNGLELVQLTTLS